MKKALGLLLCILCLSAGIALAEYPVVTVTPVADALPMLTLTDGENIITTTKLGMYGATLSATIDEENTLFVSDSFTEGETWTGIQCMFYRQNGEWLLSAVFYFYPDFSELVTDYDPEKMTVTFTWHQCDENDNVLASKELGTMFAPNLPITLGNVDLRALPHVWTGFTGYYSCAVVNVDSGRLKMRKEASTSSEVLGKYENGTLVEVYRSYNGWCKVQVGGREGYMQEKFLQQISSPLSPLYYEGQPGYAAFGDENGQTLLYSSPSEKSNVVGDVYGRYVTVIAEINDTWLQVYTEKDGVRVYGYTSALDIVQTDNFATCVVDTSSTTGMVHLRTEPSTSSASKGQYYSGVTARNLFDYSVENDGWQKVRIGNRTGYIINKFLDFSSAGTQSYLPPAANIVYNSLVLYPTTKSDGVEPVCTVTRDTPITILADVGDGWYQVLVGNYWEGTYGYIKAKNLTKVNGSYEVAVKTVSETGIYQMDQDGILSPNEMLGTLPAGTIAALYGEPDEAAFVQSASQREYLACDVQLKDGTLAYGYLPRDVLDLSNFLN